jgi:ribose transport system permease protein
VAPDAGEILVDGEPVTYSIWILVVAALACGFVLSRTKFGRWLYAVGGNPEAARLSGINVRRMKVAAFAFSGLAAGIGGAIVVSRTATGQAGNGTARSGAPRWASSSSH